MKKKKTPYLDLVDKIYEVEYPIYLCHHLNDDKNINLFTPTEKELKEHYTEMGYSKYVVNRLLKMRSPAWGSIRKVVFDTVITDDIKSFRITILLFLACMTNEY